MIARRTAAVINEGGVHWRAWHSLTEIAGKFTSSISVTGNGVTVDGKAMSSLITIAEKAGNLSGGMVEIEANGEDAEEAVVALCNHVESGFGERMSVQGGAAAERRSTTIIPNYSPGSRC